jgi:hypothetical protein
MIYTKVIILNAIYDFVVDNFLFKKFRVPNISKFSDFEVHMFENFKLFGWRHTLYKNCGA